MKRNLLSVFLASPCDLQEEREAARATAERINKTIPRRLDWQIEVWGWEDALPGVGRPQSLINEDLDACDLFLGMLGRRWGSSTGNYSSGFEEEFIRASERRADTGKPEIWLYFKYIDEETAIDPGQELERVLKFKADQIQRKQLLFKEFKNLQEWKQLIYDDLMRYLLNIALKPPKPTPIQQSLPGQTEASSSAVEGRASEAGKPYPIQITDLFRKLDENVAKEGRHVLDFWDRVRLSTLTSAWISEVQSGKILGVRETNVVYHRRQHWELSAEEGLLLFRSMIGDTYDVRPGWHWVRDWDDTDIENLLCTLAIKDSVVAVRRDAFSLLAHTGYDASREILENGLLDKDDEVVLQAIELFKANGQIGNLDLLGPLLESSESRIRDAALAARIEILYLESPNDAFSELIRSGAKIPALLLTKADGLSLDVDKELLVQALDSAEASVRRFSARQLRRAKILSRQTCEKLLEDTHADVRREGLLGLVELGEEIDEELVRRALPRPYSKVSEDEVMTLILRARDPQELMSSVDWYVGNGDVAYRVLAVEHFELLEDRIRSDLDQRFDILRQESAQRLRAKYGEVAGQSIIELWIEKDVNEFIRAKFISAALAGLAHNGQPEDVTYARMFLGNTLHNLADPEAIKLCARFGDASDAVSLTGVYFTTRSRLVFTTHSRLVFTTHDRPVFTRRLPDGESVALFLQQILLSGGERSWSIYT